MEEENQIKADVEEADIANQPEFKFIPGNHEWRQQGPYCICKSCDLEHAVYIGMEHMMIGVKEDGTPILKTRKSLGFM